jgi:membrane-associated protease RseP (regulator of RpoE activity)
VALPRRAPSSLRAVLLLAATAVCTTILAPAWYLGGFDDSLLPLLWPATVRAVLGDSALWQWGLQFSLAVLLILGSHELGHYFTCRFHRVACSLPHFLPAPIGLGTFGAFIRVRGPIRSRRQLFDIGISGPIAGFVVLVPFLLYGIAHSELLLREDLARDALVLLPGDGLLMRWVTGFFHDPSVLSAEWDEVFLLLHPFALAAWTGLLVTSLNLLPLAQLDGGHILYALFPDGQRRYAWPLWVCLVIAGPLFWYGWWLWAGIVLFMGPRHPRVWNETLELDRKRKWLAIFALVMFLLCFMPTPIVLLGL